MILVRNEDELGSLILGEESNKRMCRFCLSESNEIRNPLLDACLCKGSMKYVHFECLQTWLRNKINIDHSSGLVTLQWKFLSCELCKERLPISFKIAGKNYDLLDFSDQEKKQDSPTAGSFLILENFSKEGQAFGLYFIDFSSKNQFTFVRK